MHTTNYGNYFMQELQRATEIILTSNRPSWETKCGFSKTRFALEYTRGGNLSLVNVDCVLVYSTIN